MNKSMPQRSGQYPNVRYDANGKPLNDLERIMHELMELKQMIMILILGNDDA